MTGQPNIVLIFTDQQRADTFGYAGDPVASTPNADRLTAEGVVFPRCCASSPVCMTTRASLISGKPVNQHGGWSFADPELRHGSSHVRNIRDAGYHTAVVGKTHLWMHGKGHARDRLAEMYDWGYLDAMETTGPTESMTTDSAYTDHVAEKGLLDIHREVSARPFARSTCPNYWRLSIRQNWLRGFARLVSLRFWGRLPVSMIARIRQLHGPRRCSDSPPVCAPGCSAVGPQPTGGCERNRPRTKGFRRTRPVRSR